MPVPEGLALLGGLEAYAGAMPALDLDVRLQRLRSKIGGAPDFVGSQPNLNSNLTHIIRRLSGGRAA